MLGGRITPTNISTHPDQVQHSRRPTSAPVLNRFNSSISSFFSSSIYLWDTPRGPIPQPYRSPPLVRDFRPLIPTHGDRRLHGRLDGQSPAVGLHDRHQPRTFPSPRCRQSVSSLGGRAFHPTFKETSRTHVHSNHHHIPRHRPTHHEPAHNPTHHQPDNPTRTLSRPETPHHDGRRSLGLHVAGSEKDPRPRPANDGSPSVPC